MKKIITLALCTLVAGLDATAWTYSGPWDERMAPGYNHYDATLGRLAQHVRVAAIADVIAETPPPPPKTYQWEDGSVHIDEMPDMGSFTVRVVTPIYGCTNGQEFVFIKRNPKRTDFSYIYESYDPNFEYYPTNNSRIVFVGFVPSLMPAPLHISLSGSMWVPVTWQQPPETEIIIPPTNELWFYDLTRSWWYDGYQDNLPYTHLTNLVQAARRERNWTNYYHAVRDAVPSLSSAGWKARAPARSDEFIMDLPDKNQSNLECSPAPAR